MSIYNPSRGALSGIHQPPSHKSVQSITTPCRLWDRCLRKVIYKWAKYVSMLQFHCPWSTTRCLIPIQASCSASRVTRAPSKIPSLNGSIEISSSSPSPTFCPFVTSNGCSLYCSFQVSSFLLVLRSYIHIIPFSGHLGLRVHSPAQFQGLHFIV